MNLFAILSFFFFTGLVAFVSWYKTRQENLTTSEGYFLGGRSLGFFMVGGSLFLTNMSANNFIGENESVYLTNMAVMAWGMSSIIAMLIVSEFFMPIYLRSGMITTPDFLEERFDPSVKYWVSVLFVLGYAINLMPPVLYAGALAFNGMFGISDLLGLDSWTTLWILIFAIGTVGSIYAIFGGLKAIAVSDAMTGVGMVVGGLMVPYFALKYLGDGNLFEGWNIITSSKTEHLNAIGGPTDPVPFSTLFTGMLLVNLHYWGTEQYIMQRALAAKNLAEGQKGIILAGFGKV
ncbi:MAG: solute:sodium symporter family transporter, partial [Chitinophagales bacterium]